MWASIWKARSCPWQKPSPVPGVLVVVGLDVRDPVLVAADGDRGTERVDVDRARDASAPLAEGAPK